MGQTLPITSFAQGRRTTAPGSLCSVRLLPRDSTLPQRLVGVVVSCATMPQTQGLESGVERLTGSGCVQQLDQGPRLFLSAPSVAGDYSDHHEVSYNSLYPSRCQVHCRRYLNL